MPVSNQTIRGVASRDVPMARLLAFIHNWDYHLAEINVYADGFIDCWGLVDFEGFKHKIRQGWVVTHLPEGAKVRIGQLAFFMATDVWSGVSEEEFIKEVADEIERLNSRPTARDRCMVAWDRFNRTKSDEAREALRLAYEAVPAHLRGYVLGDMDAKDIPIRMAIYGREAMVEEIQEFMRGIEAMPRQSTDLRRQQEGPGEAG